MRIEEPICDASHINKEREAQIARMIPTEDEAIDASGIFSQLSSPTRIRLLSMLAVEKMCVCELADVLNLSQPAVSHHLRLLRQSGIVRYRKSGKRVVYYIADPHAEQFIKNIIQT